MSNRLLEDNIHKFSEDVQKHSGYIYSSTSCLSSKMANSHISELVLQLVDLDDKTVIDVGCGDGTYTLELSQIGKAGYVLGFDPAEHAIEAAKRKTLEAKTHNIEFLVADVYGYKPDRIYDVAVVRGVLHHLYQPELGIVNISKFAKKIVVIEPNGYNPIVKLLELFSPYHIEHEEKSYSPAKLERWFTNRGGTTEFAKFAGLVPFFCPAPVAKFLKSIEPVVEKIPLLRKVICGNFYLVVSFNNGGN